MPPPNGISYAMMVAWQPIGGRNYDNKDQHIGDRPGEGKLSGLRGAADGTVLYNRALSRVRLATLLADQPSCIVAVEACATSHHWGRRCKTNANSSQFSSDDDMLGREKAAPLGESSSAVQLEIQSALEGVLLVKVVMDRGMDGCEFLQRSRPTEAKHYALPTSERLVRILRSVVGPPASFPKIGHAEFPQRRAV